MTIPPEDKKIVRAAARKRRKEAANAADAGVPRSLADRVASILVDLEVGCLATYAAKGTELPVDACLDWAVSKGWKTVLPVVLANDAALEFRAWKTGEAMVRADFGIDVPSPDAAVLVPTVILVPMLAFTRSGYRLGYGGGFYDRTLEALRLSGEVLAVGVAYAGQEVDQLPLEPHDQPLDWMVTEKDAWRCSGL